MPNQPKIRRNSIVHGNCLDVLDQIKDRSIDFVLTDPPYLVNYRSRDGRTVPNDDNESWLRPAFSQVHRVMRDDSLCVSFYGWGAADKFLAAWHEAGFTLVGHMTFAKPYSSTQRFLRYQHEQAYLLAKGRPQRPANPIGDVLPWEYSGNRLHPTQKPLSALIPLIASFTRPGDLVLDPFCGSGSTCAAAQRLGRSYLGIELLAEYHAIATKRLAEASLPRAEVPIAA